MIAAIWLKKSQTANAELTKWIQDNPAEAQKILIEELKAETEQTSTLKQWRRRGTAFNFSVDVPQNLVAKAVQDAKDAGFLKGSTDTSKLIESP